MVNTTDFAKRLQKILEHYGVSATAFSEEIEFNRSTISHLLSGRNKPSLEFVMKVLQKYPEVELYWLLNGKGSFPLEKNQRTIERNSSTSNLDEDKNVPSGKKRTSANESPNSAIDTHEKSPPSEKDIDRIVIFYKDGSFKAYKN